MSTGTGDHDRTGPGPQRLRSPCSWWKRRRIVIRMHLYGFKQSPHIALGRQGHASGPDQTRTGEGNWSVNGEDFSGSNSFPISLEPAGSATFVITGDSMVRTGYLEFRGDRPYFFGDLATTFFYQVKQGGELIELDWHGTYGAWVLFRIPYPAKLPYENGNCLGGACPRQTLGAGRDPHRDLRPGRRSLRNQDRALRRIQSPVRGRVVSGPTGGISRNHEWSMWRNSFTSQVLRQDTLSSGAVQFTNTPPDRWCFDGDCSLDEASP